MFVHINKDFASASVATSTPEIILSSTNPDVFGGHSYTILTSSTMSNIEANYNFDFRKIFDYVMYAFTGIMMIWLSIKIIGHLRKENHQQTQ